MLHFTAVNDGRMTEAAKRQVAEEQERRNALFKEVEIGVLIYECVDVRLWWTRGGIAGLVQKGSAGTVP